jgi:glucose-1-phosphate adenylyltransferase
MKRKVLAMILAGGEGTRLAPLTTFRAKPAVPFGGKYRIIDFVLSNFVNSGINSIFVLTQFKSQSLSEHLINGWNISSKFTSSHFLVPVPAQMQTSERKWYTGTADAIFQNKDLINDSNPDFVAIFGGDHIYRMDVSQMVDFHAVNSAICTIAVIPVPIAEASEFGVIQVDEDSRIIGFQEKPKDPKPMPGNPNYALVSMGNYIFSKDELCDLLEVDAANATSSNDFGKDILPSLVETGKLFAYNFDLNRIPGMAASKPYWKDVGSLKAYFEANMDLRAHTPKLDLYNENWPIFNYRMSLPPAKFVHNKPAGKTSKPRIGHAVDSIVCDGCIVSGATVIDSVLFNSVHIHSYSTVNNSIILNDVSIGEHSCIYNTIIDKHVIVPPNTIIGYNRVDDEARFFVQDFDEEKGTWLTVVPKNYKF